jgi:hypothetical protein
VQARRGAVRDALTLFDESALVLAYPEGDVAPMQLAQRAWLALLHGRRGDWHGVLKPYLFGHAVLQKLQTPYTAITAQVWLLPYQSDAVPRSVGDVDVLLANSLHVASQQGRIHPQALLPLPVLGVPNWWADNQAPQFYADERVFRPLSRGI